MTDRERFRAVLDTNVTLAALLSRNPNSPTVELIVRWRNGEFDLLYSQDTLAELEEKLIAKGVNPELGDLFIADLLDYGLRVEGTSADVIPVIEEDPDDDLILACAEVGQATHLVTYDPHFEVLGGEYHGIQIMDALSFLYLVRGDVRPEGQRAQEDSEPK